jgi:hypothetical protein
MKQVEMTKFKKFVPEKEHVDWICKTPDSSVIKTIKDQKNQKVRERTKRIKEEKYHGASSEKMEESKEEESKK